MSSVEILLRAAFAGLVYPGLLFLILIGLLAESFRRRFAARAEGRESPPWLQPLYDIRKLFSRSETIPAGTEAPEDDPERQAMAATRREGSRLALYAIPLAGLLALVAGAVLLPVPGNLWPYLNNDGANHALGADLLAVSLLFLVPALGSILLGSLGGSVYGQLAGSRIFQLLVACALPYAVAVFGPALAFGSLNFQQVADASSTPMLGVKALCGILFLLCLPVILRLKPMVAAPGEVLEGITTDLSGTPLALYRLMLWSERLALPLLFAVLFIPFAWNNPVVFVAGVLLALIFIAVIENLFSHVRRRDALNFYLRYANPAAIVLLVLVAFAVKP
ncbi:MAG TPA: NADH-quinone oxidoreductase subunit H [Chloroflexia bacterium]|nr:NADH-quinone oxidoreductase subunit H [Chloroflexia bacterium]